MPQGFHGLQKYYKFRVACYIVMLVSESYPQPISGQLEKPGFCCRFLLLTNLRFWTKGNAGIRKRRFSHGPIQPGTWNYRLFLTVTKSMLKSVICESIAAQ